jgi:hypothetical protein
VVPADHAAGRVRAGSQADAAAGADDGDRLLALAVGLLIPTRSAADVFAGWWQLIERLGAAPRVLVWDGEGAIGRWRGGKIELTAECQAFRGTLGREVVVLRPREPEHKGMIERRMTTWSARSCPAAASPARRTSTPSCSSGWRW